MRPVLRFVVALVATFTLLFALPAAAFIPPPLTGHVVDAAGALTPAEIDALDRKLERVRAQTGFEIAVLLAGSLGGETIEDAAYDTFNTWKLGQKGKDNGVLLLIAPAERRARIETGRGVGGALTDLQSNDILRNTIAPLLRQDRFRDAIDQGTDAIVRTLVQGTAPPGDSQAERPPGQAPPPAAPPMSPLRMAVYVVLGLIVLVLAVVSPAFRSFLLYVLLFGRGGGGRGGSGFRGGGGTSGGGGSSDSY